MMNPLTSSEMKAWQGCQRGWWMTYYLRLRRRNELPSLPTIGNLCHDGLEAYYRDAALDPVRLVREEADKLLFQYPDYGEQIAKDAELAAIMLEGYLQWVEETGADAEFEFVGSEQVVSAEVGPFVLRGKIDARLRRATDGSLLQLEHKTVGNLTDHPKWAQSNSQFLTYDLLAFLTKPDGVQTDGVIVNMLRRVKRTARANPPFYGRHEVRHNVDELRAHYKHVIAIGSQIQRAREMLDNGADPHYVCPPAPSREHLWSCACGPVTTMFDDGSDVDGYLRDYYEEYDPFARYEPEPADAP